MHFATNNSHCRTTTATYTTTHHDAASNDGSITHSTATTVPRMCHALALTALSSSFRRRQPISHAAICPATIGHRDFRFPAHDNTGIATICLSVSIAAILRIVTTHGVLHTLLLLE
jgi:hypothetical protein